MNFFNLLVALTVCIVGAYQDIPERARSGRLYKEMMASQNLQSLKAGDNSALTWQSQVDHFDPTNNATFTQRYYVDAQYWEAGGSTGPVFFLISGEGTCSSPPTGYVASLGQKYGALLVTLEHRFYGESIPNGNALNDNYKFLSVEQALADLSTFTDYIKSTTPKTAAVPWVIFGGSYSGGLSSWYRATYPEQSVAALSSSGVVNCIIDFYQFDMQISAAVGNACGNKVKRVQQAFKQTIDSKGEAGLQEVLGKFYCESDMSAEDFYFMIADSWSMTVQYSAKSQLCDALSDIDSTTSDEVVMDTFAALSNDFWGKDFCAGGFYNTKQLKDPTRWDVNSRSWRYQTCSQVSYFNTAPPSGSIRDTGLDMEYHLKQCAEVFGGKMFPSSVSWNSKMGGQFPHATKTFYSNFQDDPWQQAGVWFAPSSSQPYHLAECDDCGHCMDLHAPSESDPKELQQSRAEFEGYLANWLAAADTASKK